MNEITQSTILHQNCGTCKHCKFVELMRYMYKPVLYCNSRHEALWGIDWITLEGSPTEDLSPGNAVCESWGMRNHDNN
jgi:hypothetical protein